MHTQTKFTWYTKVSTILVPVYDYFGTIFQLLFFPNETWTHSRTSKVISDLRFVYFAKPLITQNKFYFNIISIADNRRTVSYVIAMVITFIISLFYHVNICQFLHLIFDFKLM